MDDLAGPFVDSRDFARIARAIRFLDDRWIEQPRLPAVARAAGLSEFHFNRLFRRWAGLTPKQYLAHLTSRAAHAAVQSERSVLEAAHALGLSGPGRLHDLLVVVDGMSPGEIKSGGSGVTLRAGFTPTPFGTALIAATPRGLTKLAFIDAGGERAAFAALRAEWPGARHERDDPGARDVARRLWSTDQDNSRKPLALAVRGTNFELQVWRALVDLAGRGQATTYGAVAAAIGAPASARAVGNAVGANPVAWVIPCHRVLRSSGALGGYRWGPDRKRTILAWERTDPRAGAALR
jgi:AraC family transcriptional regulator of adaptative response/methylated-DNA-[protein]-cysteine methyltransferase